MKVEPEPSTIVSSQHAESGRGVCPTCGLTMSMFHPDHAADTARGERGIMCGRLVASPHFGQRVENVMASESNPLRFGLFVEVVQRPKGGMNPGRWWRLTNGDGEFWLANPANCRPALVDGETE